MVITEEVLLENGFVKEEGSDGPFYVKGKVGVVKNLRWQPCNVDTGNPKGTLCYVDTMEELAELAQKAGLTI